MNPQTKQLLARWNSIENGDGMRLAVARLRTLRIARLILCAIVIYAINQGLHAAVIAVAAAALGWMIAETNALATRLAQWPLFRPYIDWPRVQNDLRSYPTSDKH